MSISVDTLRHLLETWGYIAVFFFVLIESSGVPFPGETMLITAAAYAGAGHLRIPFVIAAAAGGAMCGDNLGYWIGRTGGRSLALRYGRYVRLDERKLDAAQDFFRRHGDKAVFVGRFVAVLRAWNAFLAGVNRMSWPKFVIFDAAGAITWATLWGVLAFELGKNLPLLEKIIRYVGVAGIALLVIVAVALFLLHRRARAAERAEEGGADDRRDRAGGASI